jgi:DNA-binding transcriptional ArsR family regulator
VNASVYENDAINVNVWQDIFVTKSKEPPADRPARRQVSNVELLKALADPLRMNMMYVLTRNTSQRGMPVMTVKELAAALGEPQTKLYRHVKHLEAAGLIAAVSSRIVSGIVEQRYQAVGSTFIGDGMSEDERTSPEAEAMVAAALEMFRRQYFGALRARQSDQQADPADNRRPLMALTDGRVPAARAAAIRAQLRALIEEVNAEPALDSEELVPINVLVGYFGTEQN